MKGSVDPPFFSDSILGRFNRGMAVVLSTVAIFAPFLALLFVNNRIAFLIGTLIIAAIMLWGLAKRGIIFWAVITVLALLMWYVPFVFSFTAAPLVLIILVPSSLLIGFVTTRLYHWKWGIWLGLSLLCGIVGIQMFLMYQFTLSWQYNKALDPSGNPAVSIVYDEKDFPYDNMIREIALFPDGNKIAATRGPDSANPGHSLLLGNLQTGYWQFFGKGSSQALAINSYTNMLYVGEASKNRIFRLNGNTLHIDKNILLNKPVRMSLSRYGDKLFTLHEDPHLLRILDANTLSVISEHRIEGVNGLYGMHIDYKNENAYFGCTYRYTGRLLRYSLPEMKLEVTGNIGSSYIWGITSNRRTGKLYVALPFLGQIAVLDPITLEKQNTVQLRRGIRDMAINEARGILYVGNFVTGHVTAFDLTQKRIVWKVYVGPRVRGIELDTKNEFVYVACGLGIVRIDEEIARNRFLSK